ncbi:putative phosphonate metabolism protein [Arboricoccus pini]|uniref:Putative phosphonate metabolism protein n=1 Tax=Arboricoccus pini TaxID=1963835 RepID=A0A212QQI8_9PROT|nr:DUF1045 domain-containing protein [Arboricoccus pini]SNB61691.1 putative phosphonate metabolism protein [Arboricoccus pini]
MRRYAVYAVPPERAPLMQFANQWLGWDPYKGKKVVQPILAGVAPEALARATADPAHYGFHGTLKAPFELASGIESATLHQGVADLAQGHRPFSLDLRLAAVGDFLALIPREPLADLDDLAATCVEELDALRAPLSEADIARRNPARLLPEQRDYLERFGYPYVFEFFQFHMTLTGRVYGDEKARLLAALQEAVTPLIRDPFVIDALGVFEQRDRDSPFVVTGRYEFQGPALS